MSVTWLVSSLPAPTWSETCWLWAMARADIVVVGGTNFDYLIRGSRLPAPGETISGDVFREGPGGKGANQAVGAARLGAKVAIVSRVGIDARGDALERALMEAEVDVGALSRDPELPSGVALILVDHAGEKQILTAPGANQRLGEAEIEAARELIAFAKVVVAGLEVPIAAVAAALRLGKAAGAKTLLDPAPPVPLSEELLRLVDVIRPNAAEAESLTNVRVHDARSAAVCGRVLIARGVGAAIIPAGDAGNLVVTREEQHLLPHLRVEAVDATGAGDAFIAGLAAALAEGRSLIDAASFGGAAAAFSTTRVGAQAGLPRREDVISLLGQLRGPAASVPI
jgi:ribokinase